MSGRAHTILLILVAVAVNALFVGNLAERSMPERAPALAADAHDVPRLVVFGVDGLDEALLRGYLDTHGDQLPAFRRLAREGAFQPLEPEMPPESPVSWASLMTGVNPAKHRVFDFIIPTSDYQPVNGMVDLKRARLLFDKVPVRGPRLRPRLAAPTFIERIRHAGYGTLSLRQPLLFPAPNQPGGRWLSGLGTPDVAGTSGYPTAFSNATGFVEGSTTFGTYRKRLEGGATATVFESELRGPFDPSMGRDARGARQRAVVPVRFERVEDELGQRVRVRIAGAEIEIEVGERTGLLPVEFTLGTLPRIRVPGIVRFEVRQFEPLVVLSSPVMADPSNPVFAITSPADYASELQERYGNFETLGWQEETFPLNDRLQDDQGFLNDVLQDIERGAGILLGEMGKGDPLVFNVITGLDRACHAFWRYRDPRHPLHADIEKALGDPLLQVLTAIDRVLGQVHSKLDPRDTLLVVSDHGFQTWRYGVNVNQWLLDEGYLVLKGEADHKTLDHVFAGLEGTSAVDWSKTRAFAMGLGQVYINSKARFDEGIVDEADAPALARELQQRLLAMRNPYAGISDAAEGLEAQPLRRVILLRELWKGPYLSEVADIQLAFARGYRISWQTVLLGDMGKGREVCEENRAPWSGDHCSTDASLVPGVVLCNHPFPGDAGIRPWNVKDICATALVHFGLDLAPLEGEAQPIPIVPHR